MRAATVLQLIACHRSTLERFETPTMLAQEAGRLAKAHDALVEAHTATKDDQTTFMEDLAAHDSERMNVVQGHYVVVKAKYETITDALLQEQGAWVQDRCRALGPRP